MYLFYMLLFKLSKEIYFKVIRRLSCNCEKKTKNNLSLFLFDM